MGVGSIWHWIILALVIVLLFGRGRISDIMGDVAKGIKSFKKGLADEPEAPQRPAEISEQKTVEASAEAKDTAKSS